ncbi:dTDP-4-dehydrorhamnose reductase [Altibacter sp.]|uniref:dTDP-4-dehydrorhamnose reductase n=1 Tax=Altibacter sp. TaxID=2024823 RepID=UPI000C8BC7A4|nr:dTDP-4-dehydrorhamnose reductase [Altibacter sp.]MAP55654.1 dTDP-4-dehydrorhamnose reductase [Altibacter sp.]|tara:strand:+ start:420 stop:1280 length:861 start_codon:yes stop_codon:yes gene_type:complete
MRKVLVTGANGQLGRCIADAAHRYPELELFFATRAEFDVDDLDAVSTFFESHIFDVVINTAAYTAVDQAEEEPEKAYHTNHTAVAHLATICKEQRMVLVHFSTDYVFDGNKGMPYTETDPTHPINVYGASKQKGEEAVSASGADAYIFRTSWLYSQYGKNFYTTMLRLAKERKILSITTGERGTPTNANVLAEVSLQIIAEKTLPFDYYHLSNEGEATWFDFAEMIFQEHENNDIHLERTDHFKTKARRPVYSVLSKERIKDVGNVMLPHWKVSLKKLIADQQSAT